MMLSHLAESKQARAARLMAEAMQRDVEAQRPLIDARAQGKTDAVYWELASCDARMRELEDQNCRLRHQVQRTMIQAYLAMEKVRAEIARSKALLGLN